MRSIKKSIILILTGLSSLIAQQPPSRVVFFGRSILSDHDKRQFLTLLSANAQPLAFVSPPFLRTTQYDSPIDDKYKTIRPERSLLINNCDGFCDDPALAFTSVVTVAASGLGNSSASLVPKHWFDLASDAIPAFWQRFPPIWDGRLPTDPFQLLAVVNRLDFAKSSCSTRKPEEVCWTGAELHMVYGSKDGGPFNVIVELVLPPLNWTSLSALALRWFSLQDLTTPNQMRTSLETLIKDEAKSLQSARVRSNSSTGGGNSPWFLTQWTLSSTGIQQVSLDDEIRRECTSHTGSYTTIGVGCEQSENPQCQRYPQLFQKVQSIAVQGGQSYEIAPNYGELLVRSECYANGHKNTTFEGMDGPKGSCSADNSVNSPEGAVSLARNILSLQQCSFCHGAESNNTNFVHIHNRDGGNTIAALSNFLTGGIPSDKAGIPLRRPTTNLLDLPDPKFVFEAPVSVTWPGGGNCALAKVPITRYFNDLARRSLFLASILVGTEHDPTQSPDADLTRVIQSYGPDFRH